MLGITLKVLTFIFIADIMCKWLLPKYFLMERGEAMVTPKKRVFLFFYKNLDVGDRGQSPYGKYCTTRKLVTPFEAERIIRQDKLK